MRIQTMRGVGRLFFAVAIMTLLARTVTAETADEAYRLAVGLHNVPLYEEAAQKLQEFVKNYPQDERLGMVYYRLGDCQVQLKQHEEALASFQVVVDKYPLSLSAAEARFRVGELNQLLGNSEKAAEVYDQFLAKHPDHDLTPLVREKQRSLLIASLYRRIETDPAATLTEAARLSSRTDSVGEEALFVMNSLAFNKGAYEAAVKAGTDLVKRFADSKHGDEVRLNTANALAKLNRLEECLVFLSEVKSTRLDEVLYLKGSTLGKQNVPDKAKEAYRALVKDHRESRFRPYALYELGSLGDLEAWQQLVKEYPEGELADEVRYREAVRLAGTGEKEKALGLLSAMSKETARRQDADLLMAELQSGTRLVDAMALLAKLEQQKVAPERLARARYAVALAALDQGKPEAALAPLGAILKDPASADLHADCLYRTGLAQEKLKRPEPARTTYKQLVDRFPSDRLTPFALLRMAALQMEKQPDDALAALQKIIKEYPQFEHRGQAADLIADIRYRKAWDAYEAKQHAEAAAIFDLLKEHATYGVEAAYLAGVCYRNAEKLPEAERCLSLLLQKYPDYEYAKDARELLGEILSAQKKWQDAATHYASYVSGIQDEKTQAAVQLKLGMALYQLNQAPRAREALLVASERGEPAVKAKALFFLGELLLMQKKHAEAKEYFLKVGLLYRHDELTPASLLEAAKCMKATGEAEKGRNLLQRLIKEFPKSPHRKEADKLLSELQEGR